MYRIKRIQKRPSADIPWSFEKYPSSTDFLEYFEKTFVKTKKILFRGNPTFSHDQLTCTVIQVWKSRQDFLDLLTDDYIFEERNKKSNYDIDNDITSEFIVENNINDI